MRHAPAGPHRSRVCGPTGDYTRWLYRGGSPNRFAQLQNRLSAVAFSAGLLPSHAGALEVRGRRSGKTISLPVVIADYEGERYLVSMLGREANWVRNLEADGGRAELRHGRREPISLVEVDPALRAPILRRYLDARSRCPSPHPGRPQGPPRRVRGDRRRLPGLPHRAPGGHGLIEGAPGT